MKNIVDIIKRERFGNRCRCIGHEVARYAQTHIRTKMIDITNSRGRARPNGRICNGVEKIDVP